MADTDDYYPLVELEIEEPEVFGPAPQRFGFTTRPQSFTTVDAQGGLHTFLPGLLSADVPARRGDFYSGASASESAPSFRVTLDAFPAVEFFAMRIRFEWIRVRIWWWRPGWTLEEAVQVWVGRLRDPIIDPDRREFSASAPPGTTEIDVEFPPGFIGDEDRFPSAPESSQSVPLPVIIGTPRNVPIYAVQDDSIEPSPPAVFATARYVIAGHPIGSTSLTIRSDGDVGFIAVKSVAEGLDGRGERYSYVVMDNTDPGWAPAMSLYAGEATTGIVQGQIGPGGTAIKGLGDVLIYMLHTYAREQFFEIDRDRIYAARAKLNAFRVGSWFNNRTDGESLLRILKTRYEGQFPVSFNFANGRFGWDYTGFPRRVRRRWPASSGGRTRMIDPPCNPCRLTCCAPASRSNTSATGTPPAPWAVCAAGLRTARRRGRASRSGASTGRAWCRRRTARTSTPRACSPKIRSTASPCCARASNTSWTNRGWRPSPSSRGWW